MESNRLRLDSNDPSSQWGWSGIISFSASFFIFFMMNVAANVPTISIALILLAATTVFLIHPISGFIILYRESLLLMPAGLCLASTLWSQYPSFTLYFGIQFAIVSIIGISMAYWHRAATIIGQMAASFVYLAISVVAGNRAAWSNQGETVAVGLSGGKSYLGAIASTGALAAVYAIQYGFKSKKNLVLASGILCFGASLFTIIGARASGALVGVVINTCTFFGLQWLSRLAPEYRAKILIAVVPIVVLGVIFGDDLWLATLKFFNKSADLTGRVFLWERARAAIADRPWLGTGFNGFWVIGNPDAELLWNYAAIKSKSGFNFHNTPLEFAVAFGVPLAALLCAVFIFAFLRKISLVLSTGNAAAAFGATILVEWISHAAFESGGIGTFTSTILLIYMSLSGTRIAREGPVVDRPQAVRPADRMRDPLPALGR